MVRGARHSCFRMALKWQWIPIVVKDQISHFILAVELEEKIDTRSLTVPENDIVINDPATVDDKKDGE